jgi:hypothetical protein
MRSIYRFDIPIQDREAKAADAAAAVANEALIDWRERHPAN